MEKLFFEKKIFLILDYVTFIKLPIFKAEKKICSLSNSPGNINSSVRQIKSIPSIRR